ncbi:MAG: N-acetylmuramoyl-L-alanine amidase, partial [Prevotellaceae bacterium]|nr:N-acetylmuramoyl-L-alanine amidase [Prevotellaceae bacterium]
MKNKFLTYFANKMPYIVCYLTFFCISIIFANAQNYVSQQRIKKIVIDAGHGGKDPGARGKNINEKDITLSVALKFGEFINKNFPEIEVIFTRNKDVFIELNERTNIANRNNADLFISIHVNSFKNSTPRGVSTWIMGGHKSQANLEVSRLENSVITMEDDYTTKYQGFDPTSPESYIIFSLMQFAHRTESVTLAEFVQQELLQTSPLKGDKGVQQAGFLVLWKTAMPSILIELGFISNPNDEQILADA